MTRARARWHVARTLCTRMPELEAPQWHALDGSAVIATVASDHELGLTAIEAERRRALVGPNALREAERRSTLAVFVTQFKSPLIYLLFVAAAVALALGHTTDAGVIGVVVLLNAVIGAIQEGRAERSLAALRRLASHNAHVVRDGRVLELAARDVVPGDVLLLEAGDAVAADARLLEGAALQIAEAALTGESLPVDKDRVPLAHDTPLADRRNMVYAGTHVTAGRARAIVVVTGPATEIGHIAALAESAKEPATPLERRVAQFGRYVVFASVGAFLLVNLIGLVRGIAFSEILMVGISQVVGMIPEGLPVAMTIALAVGVQRMARRRAVVRRLAAVETLGSTTVICSDKTGTLTRNEMTVAEVHLPAGRTIVVTGVGYEPVGVLGATLDEPGLCELLEAAVLCNDARLVGPEDTEPRWRAIGDPTEVALVTLAIKAGLVPDELRAHAPRLAEIPFDPAAKLMATQHAGRVIVKGAPEAVLELCTGADPAAIQAVVDEMARRALRVLAFAVIRDGDIDGRAGFVPFRGRAALLGLVGQLDPPRDEVRDAIVRCQHAGIRPVMVTGDHAATGMAIALRLGIGQPGDLALDGRALDTLSDRELADTIDDVSVFARVRPAQKLRIVEAYQRRGEVVAMTGDGVNDAPALAQADVGVAMGLTGTEVAKEAAKIVIVDDNFSTIVSAVEEGRVVYRNIKKAVLLLFSTSAAEVLILMLALLLGYPPPLAAVQILWINLVTEGLVTVNLIVEPAEGDEMSQRPIPRDEALVTRTLLTRMGVMVPTIVTVVLGWFVLRSHQGVGIDQVRTETFTLLAICEWFNVLNCRSELRTALTLQIFRNPWLVGGLVAGNLLQLAVVFWEPLGRMFHTVPFDLEIAITLGLIGSAVLWTEELRKWFARRSARRSP
jgi:magnesium-transporting ATPase (P-type)